MKKLFTTLGLLALSVAVSAQGIAIYLPGGDTDVSGTLIENNSGEASPYQDFDIENTSDASIILRIERVKITELDGTEDYLCWGASPETGACYPAGVVFTRKPIHYTRSK